MEPYLSIIVPTLNEASCIVDTLAALIPLRNRGSQIIVVDGGSNDGTPELASPYADLVLSARSGRAHQMNAGAQYAHGQTLLFLHADTILPHNADTVIYNAIRNQGWGRFNVEIIGTHPMLKVVARLMNMRSCLTGIATGDQALFVSRQLFQQIGGFPDQPLMEDIELCKRLRKLQKPKCISAKVLTSGRRWETRGVWKTILLMWRLRWRYWRGVPATQLVKDYQ